MSEAEVCESVLRALRRISPEADLEGPALDESLKDPIDLGSFDLLQFVNALGKEPRVDVPEADDGKLATLSGCVAYLSSRRGGKA